MRRLPLLLFVGYTLLTAAWVFGNPPFAAPDEDEHYIRALGVSTGDVVGRQTTPIVPEGSAADVRSFYTEHSEFFRTVRVPRGLMASGVTCELVPAGSSAACLHDSRVLQDTRLTTLMAGYQPAPYVLPAAALRVASSPFAALRLGRLVSALSFLLLVGIGIWCLWSADAGAVSLVGAAVALTPMAIFSGSSLNPSGVEIAAGFAFAAALLRLARGDPPSWVWVAAAAAGAALALSRSPSPAWIVLDVLLAAALVGRACAVRAVRSHRVAAAVVGACVLLNVAWALAFGPNGGAGVTAIVHQVRTAVGVLPFRLREEVGQFGWLDTPMPTLAVMAWQAMIVVLVTAAFVVARRRERSVLVAAVVVALAVPVAFSAWFGAVTAIGGGQGRHVLPAVVALPLLAGELLVRNRERGAALNLGPLVLSLFAAAGALQLVGWIWNAHRFAVGSGGPAFFLRNPEWSPPLGWWPWFVLAAVGSAVIALVSLPRALPSWP